MEKTTEQANAAVELANCAITSKKLGEILGKPTPAPAGSYVERVYVPLERYEELSKKECLLHQIQNAVNGAVESYNLKEAISLILSVLPR